MLRTRSHPHVEELLRNAGTGTQTEYVAPRYHKNMIPRMSVILYFQKRFISNNDLSDPVDRPAPA